MYIYNYDEIPDEGNKIIYFMKFSKTYPFKNFTKDFEDKTSNLFYGFDVLSYSLNL